VEPIVSFDDVIGELMMDVAWRRRIRRVRVGHRVRSAAHATWLGLASVGCCWSPAAPSLTACVDTHGDDTSRYRAETSTQLAVRSSRRHR